MLQDGGPEITQLVPSLLVQSEAYYDSEHNHNFDLHSCLPFPLFFEVFAPVGGCCSILLALTCHPFNNKARLTKINEFWKFSWAANIVILPIFLENLAPEACIG